MAGDAPTAALTASGRAALALWFVLALAAALSGNNLLFLLVGAGLTLGFLEPWLGRRNLHGLQVERRLPEELFAGKDARGALILRGERGSAALEVEDRGAPGARARVDRLEPGAERVVPVRYAPTARGSWGLDALIVRSEHPFGWVRRELRVQRPVAVTVWPSARGGRGERADGSASSEAPRAARASADGDLDGLREAAPDEDPRAIHWPTSARVGREIAVVRGSATQGPLLVEVPDTRGLAWESAIQAASGEVQRGLQRGRAVGLRWPGGEVPATSGPEGRRRLLDALALLPERP